MTRQFSLGTVFRMADKASLRRFFEQFGAEVDTFCWEDVNRRNIQPLEKLFDTLPQSKRDEAELALRNIHALACEKGMEELAEAASILSTNDSWNEMFQSAQSPYFKAFVAWFDYRDIFDYAVQFLEVDSLGWWRKRVDLPKITPQLHEDTIENLEAEIEELLKTTQGRGYACTVEMVSRPNGKYFIFAHPDDYVQDTFMHDDEGFLIHAPIRRTFEVVFAYDAVEGTSDISARLPKRVKESLEEIFLRNVLGVKMRNEEQKPFDLSMFLDPNFQLVTRPEDRIKVGVTGITINLPEAGTVGFRTRYPKSAVQFMFEGIEPEVLRNPQLFVDRVRLRFEFLPANGGRSKSITFEIAAPFSCTLKNRQPLLEEIIHRYLKDWRIEYDHHVPTPETDSVAIDTLPLAG